MKPLLEKKRYVVLSFISFLVFIGLIAYSIQYFYYSYQTHLHHARVIDIYWKHIDILEQRSLGQTANWISNLPNEYLTRTCHPQIRINQECFANLVEQGLEEEICFNNCLLEQNNIIFCEDVCYDEKINACIQNCIFQDIWCEYEYYLWSNLSVDTTFGHNHDFSSHVFRTAETKRIIKQRYYQIIFENEITRQKYKLVVPTIEIFLKFNIGQIWNYHVYNGHIIPENLVTH